MADETILKPCSYYVVRYAPNLLRSEVLNIGILLRCPEDQYLGCLFADDFRWLRRLDPRADLALLGALQEDFERQIDANESDPDGYLKGLAESLSNTIQLEGPRGCLLENPAAGIQDVYARNVGRGAAKPLRAESRLQVKQRLTSAFVRAGIWERLEKRIPVGRWTHPGDPFTFDYGYQPNGVIHLIHALSLKRDTQLAKTLVYTLDCARRREPAELTAVVEALPDTQDEVARATHDILAAGRISVQPVAGVEALVNSVRRDLRVM